MLHLVGSSIFLYLIDDAQSNKNQAFYGVDIFNDWALYVGLCYIFDVSKVTCMAGWIEINK